MWKERQSTPWVERVKEFSSESPFTSCEETPSVSILPETNPFSTGTHIRINVCLDAGIFMVISGSTTPIPMLLLDFGSSCWLLIVQLGATVYGGWSSASSDATSSRVGMDLSVYTRRSLFSVVSPPFCWYLFSVVSPFFSWCRACVGGLCGVGDLVEALRVETS